MSDVYNPDEAVEKYRMVDDCTVLIRCRCPKCSKYISTDFDRFFPQDVGEGECYNSYHTVCPTCGEQILVIAPDVY